MLDPTPYRTLFPITERLAFFNHAGVSPLNTRTTAAMDAFHNTMARMSIGEAFEQLNTVGLDLRQRLATLINARSIDEIVIMPNTAAGINSVALSLPLRPGDNILVLDGDYPANIYPWMNLAHRGILTKFVPARDGGLDLELLHSRIDSHTRVIAMSTVLFATGFRNDLDAVGKLCRERDIFFVVDGIQSLGALPFDVQTAGVDFLACGSQKWLLGPIGTGFLYVRQELLDRLIPGAYVGASSVVDAANFLDYNFTLLPTAERFLTGSPNFAGMIGLHASLTLLQEIGIDRIAERILALTNSIIQDMQARGFHLAASTSASHRSGIVIVEVDDPITTSARLMETGIVAIPRGRGIRIAPHFYNTEEEVQRIGATLEQIER